MTSFGATTPVTSRALNTAFRALETQIAAASGSPIGSIALWAGDTTALPVGYLLCDGTPLSNASTYLPLFSVIGYKYGGSAGTFNLPSFFGAYIPFGTTTSNADSSRNSIMLSSYGWQSTGHVHTFGSVTTNGQNQDHSHLASAVTTNDQNQDHIHAQNAVNTGNVSNGHFHNFSVNTGNDSVNHYHGYQKPASSPVAAQTGGIDNAHQHPVSGTTGDITLNHFHTTNATSTGGMNVNHTHATNAANTGGVSQGHTHSSTAVVNATTADTIHSHNIAGTYVVYIIKYL